MYILMPDIPEQGNWKNSEVATIFTELYNFQKIAEGKYNLHYVNYPAHTSFPGEMELNQKIMDATADYNVEMWDVVDLPWSLDEANDLKNRLMNIGVEVEMTPTSEESPAEHSSDEPVFSEAREAHNFLHAKAQRELGIIKQQLQKLATTSALEGNHKAALLIENTITELTIGEISNDL